MKIIGRIVVAILVCIILLTASLFSLKSAEIIEEPVTAQELVESAQQVEVAKAQPTDINQMPFEDNMAIYQLDDPDSVVNMYITVRKGNASDNTNHTWAEVNDSTKSTLQDRQNINLDKTEVIFQIGDEYGPLPGELGFGEIVPNASIQLRGNTALFRQQKSYKIELFDRTGGWRGQYTIPLNKHQSDPIRFKNKLAYDLIKEIPHLVSLRTQFVRLYVKDETSDPPSNEFVDYGLFTHVEQPNRRFLSNHGLDPNGQLYKATYFEFFRYPDEIRMADDPQYDISDFEKILEVKGNQDHSKLINMLDDVNNFAIPIEHTFERYFDADNYFTWMALNILVGNIDTSSQNFFLYSPQNGEQFYFIPWDNDGILGRQVSEVLNELNDYQYWQKGIHNYWGTILHKRVLSLDIYRKKLDEKIEYLRTIITPEKIEEMIALYDPVVEPYINRMPDQYYVDMTEYYLSLQLISGDLDSNYEHYLTSLEKPQPFFLTTPIVSGGKTQFVWGDAYDFQSEDITYRLQVSRYFDFTDILLEESTFNLPTKTIDGVLDAGVYFWRVIATDESGNIQYPFDNYVDAEGIRRSGMRILYIGENGEILEGS